MKISSKLINHLDKNNIKYQIVPHKTVFTAFDKSQTLGVKLNQIVKSLLVKADNSHHLVLLPAHKMLDVKKLAKALKAKKAEIIGEKGMQKVLGMKQEALHAFASLHKIPTVVEKDLTKVKEAYFPSTSFENSLKVRVKDFLTKEKAAVAVFGMAYKKKQNTNSKRQKSTK